MAKTKYWYVVRSGGNVMKFKTLKAARVRAKIFNGASCSAGAFTIISREEVK